jgi:peptidoglycan/LPS O-acetylase OafA/YrhL
VTGREENARRNSALDSLRGIAAIAVLSFHYETSIAYYGLLGVELFFIISGYVILMTLERSISLVDFAVGRFGRLYPAYWVSVAIAGLFLWTSSQATGGSILLNTTMLQAFFNQPNIIDPYWTLKCELLFYCVMGTIFWSDRLSNIDSFALVWLVGMTLFRGSMLFAGKGGGHYYLWYVQLFLIPQFGHLFIAGMMLYRINTGRSTPLTVIAVALAILYSLFGRTDCYF